MTNLGLALGGGGARGLAHIGVLKVLDSEKIKIDALTGCSMGAIVGGLYAYFGNAKDVEEFILNAMKHPKFRELGIEKLNESAKNSDKNYFNKFLDYIELRLQAIKSLTSLSYFDEETTNEIYNILPDVTLDNLKIKFSAISTDLITGEEINFVRGKLRDVLKASSAIPGIFPPVKLDGYYLIDGYTSENVPASKVRQLGANKVVAVNVSRTLNIIEPPKNIIDILYRTEDITSYHLSIMKLKEADLIIYPEVSNYSWTDFDKAEEIIEAGVKAAEKKLNEIKELVHEYSIFRKVKNFISKAVKL
ncbi:MAG: patatin-like phospholipase family protein [Melioribacteraceae bacterium]